MSQTQIILDTERLDSDAAYREELRHRCFTDHFYLAQIMGFRDFVERVHRPAVNLYFPKNPKLSIVEQHVKKNRLHLDPRHTFKTTLGRVDTMQWILAFPEDITILNQSATQPLAAQINQKLAEYFWRPKGKASTPLQLIFPELITEKKPDATWDTMNRRAGELDHTLSFTSPQSQQSGWHPWIGCPDDMVDTTNSGIRASHESRQGVIETYTTNRYTIRPGGYLNIRGTRYHPFDLYGHILNTMDPDDWEVLVRCAMTVTSGKRLIPGEFPDEEDVELHFPELPNLTYKMLRQAFYDSYESFMCQAQNDPQGGNIQTFDEKLYSTLLTAPEAIPVLGDNVMVWRLPYGGKNYMRHAEGCVGRLALGKVFITDAWQGMWSPTNLAEKIIMEAKRHEVDFVLMEDIPGTDFMRRHIRTESMRKNFPVKIEWLGYEEDDNRRNEKIRMLEPAMRAGKICVSTAIAKGMEIRKQLLNFGLVRENGIVDCITRLLDEVPWMEARREMDEDELDLQKRRQEDAAFNAIFQQQGIDVVNEEERRRAEAHVMAMDRASSYFGMSPLPGGLEG